MALFDNIPEEKKYAFYAIVVDVKQFEDFVLTDEMIEEIIAL